MKLIVGLGNPGKKYENNRHNAGFMFLDYLVDSPQFLVGNQKQFVFDKYLQSEVCILSSTNDQQPATSDQHAGRQNQRLTTNNVIVLARPTTYMNKSGEAVKKLVKKYLSECQLLIANHLIVVHDDLDIPLGKFRIVRGYGPKQHNGIESVENHLHSKDFLRIRIGVDARQTQAYKTPGIEYVLQDFTESELPTVTNTFTKVISSLFNEKILL
ncbi:MAG: aminoacyl-tRNA hydrolase [Patescibacteria group bacterium]